jgi:hypothetical protein
MNGYELIAKMRKVRIKNPLTTSEQALYNELVAMCNDEDWTEIFSCSNYQLCNALQISENTLKQARDKLIQVGLIFYKSGKSKRQFSSYSFTKCLQTTSNFDTNMPATTSKTTSKKRAKIEDYYKQYKTIQNINKENARDENLSILEIGNTIEFIDRIKQVKLSESEVLNYWAAFNLNESETFYFTKQKKNQHFRNWLKNQTHGNGNYSAGNKSNRDKQTGANASLIAKLKQITGAG